MHLADYEASTINSRIWTQSAQFEEKLAELNEHMEKIIQMYLRNEYATINTEYNAGGASSIAEKYRLSHHRLFPGEFQRNGGEKTGCGTSPRTARVSGVFTLIQWDQRTFCRAAGFCS